MIGYTTEDENLGKHTLGICKSVVTFQSWKIINLKVLSTRAQAHQIPQTRNVNLSKPQPEDIIRSACKSMAWWSGAVLISACLSACTYLLINPVRAPHLMDFTAQDMKELIKCPCPVTRLVRTFIDAGPEFVNWDHLFHTRIHTARSNNQHIRRLQELLWGIKPSSTNGLRLPWLLGIGYRFVTVSALVPHDIERIHTTLKRFDCTAAYWIPRERSRNILAILLNAPLLIFGLMVISFVQGDFSGR